MVTMMMILALIMKIKILEDSKLELDKLDVNDISSSAYIDSPPLLDDVVQLYKRVKIKYFFQ